MRLLLRSNIVRRPHKTIVKWTIVASTAFPLPGPPVPTIRENTPTVDWIGSVRLRRARARPNRVRWRTFTARSLRKKAKRWTFLRQECKDTDVACNRIHGKKRRFVVWFLDAVRRYRQGHVISRASLVWMRTRGPQERTLGFINATAAAEVASTPLLICLIKHVVV